MGDPHGAYKAMLQCFQRSGFSPSLDELIVLGDVVDGWPDVKECMDLLMSCKNLVFVIGNHDLWALKWMQLGQCPREWTDQGGKATIASLKDCDQSSYIQFLAHAHRFYEDHKHRLFVHGGIEEGSAGSTALDTLVWDRKMFDCATGFPKNASKHAFGQPFYSEIFVGHTTTSKVEPSLLPLHISNVWFLDQGAGYEGKLTMMDVDSKEFWQSDLVNTLYDCHNARKL
jgi:serine/threonine protein phosphatase 1